MVSTVSASSPNVWIDRGGSNAIGRPWRTRPRPKCRSQVAGQNPGAGSRLSLCRPAIRLAMPGDGFGQPSCSAAGCSGVHRSAHDGKRWTPWSTRRPATAIASPSLELV